MAGMIGKKLGMTSIFDQEGRAVPVTLIDAGPCVVLGTKTKEKSGYSATLVGYGDIKESKVKLPQKKWFSKLKISPKKIIKEMRTVSDPTVKTGDKIEVNMFKAGDYVDVTGTSIGKGFQGGVKRWGWSGGGASHGSMFHRAPGSIGASSYPSRVFKGQHLPGHMGAKTRTMQSLEVVVIDPEKNLLAIRGSVPGHRGSALIIRHAKKRPPKDSNKLAEKPTEKKK